MVVAVSHHSEFMWTKLLYIYRTMANPEVFGAGDNPLYVSFWPQIFLPAGRKRPHDISLKRNICGFGPRPQRFVAKRIPRLR
jgi:hypothetical protein